MPIQFKSGVSENMYCNGDHWAGTNDCDLINTTDEIQKTGSRMKKNIYPVLKRPRLS